MLKKIAFITKVLEDGLGDIGHLVDIANPQMLKSLLVPVDLLGNSVTYQPLYIVVCCNPTPDRVRFIIESFKQNDMIDDRNNSYDLKRDDQLEEYVDHLLKANKHFILVGETYLDQSSRNLVPDIRTIQQMTISDASAGYLISYIDISIIELMRSLIPRAQCTVISEHGKRIGASFRSRFEPAYTMGFFPKNCGILLKGSSRLTIEQKATELLKMHNIEYRDRLVISNKSEIISPGSAIGFLERNLFVPGYLQNEASTTFFIQSIAGSHVSKKYNNVVFHVNEKYFYLSWLDQTFFARQGYAKIIVHTKDRTDETTLQNPAGGRNLIIFTGSKLDNHDYHILYKVAQLFGGCSGDKSAELVFGEFLVPFCQEPRRQKYFSESLQELAENYLSQNDFHNIRNYIEFFSRIRSLSREEITPTSEQIIKLMNDDFFYAWNKLIDLIHKNYNLYDKLPSILQAPIRTHEFYSAYADTILKNIHEKKYIEVLRLLSEFDPTSPDIRCIMKWSANKPKYHAIAAFIWAVIVRNEPKKDYLDRSAEEIKFDKRTGCYPHDIDRSEAKVYDELMKQYAFDKVDLTTLTMVLNDGSAMNISELFGLLRCDRKLENDLSIKCGAVDPKP